MNSLVDVTRMCFPLRAGRRVREVVGELFKYGNFDFLFFNIRIPAVVIKAAIELLGGC